MSRRHGDIRDAMLTLVGATREQTSKLERHELRGRQVADVVTRMLNSMDNRSKSQEKNLDNLAILMARMDDRLRKMEESVIQVQTPTRFPVALIRFQPQRYPLQRHCRKTALTLDRF